MQVNSPRAMPVGGLADWYLPSLNELSALYYYPNRDAIGGFSASTYWSSTQDASQSSGKWAFLMYFNNGTSRDEHKSDTYGVRPVRAF